VGYRESVKNKVSRESLMLTDDENIIDIQFAVQYRIKNPAEYLFNNRSAEAAVLQAAETSIREVVGRSKMDFVLYEGREQVGLQVSQLVQQTLDRYKVGILVSSVTVQNAQPPEQVQAAFDDAVKAGQDRERLKNEGQAYANDVVPRARGAAARLLQESEGYKQRVIAQAEGDAARFKAVLGEYSKAPAVTRERLYLDTMQQIYSSVTKVLADSKQGSQMLYLPLDKLIQQTAGAEQAKPPVSSSSPAAGTASAASAPAVDTSTSVVTETRPRPTVRPESADVRVESLRNRERESR
jgi:membrane protease subunit HflK